MSDPFYYIDGEWDDFPDEFVAALQRERDEEDAADDAANEASDRDAAERGERDQDRRA